MFFHDICCCNEIGRCILWLVNHPNPKMCNLILFQIKVLSIVISTLTSSVSFAGGCIIYLITIRGIFLYFLQSNIISMFINSESVFSRVRCSNVMLETRNCFQLTKERRIPWFVVKLSLCAWLRFMEWYYIYT